MNNTNTYDKRQGVCGWEGEDASYDEAEAAGWASIMARSISKFA